MDGMAGKDESVMFECVALCNSPVLYFFPTLLDRMLRHNKCMRYNMSYIEDSACKHS